MGSDGSAQRAALEQWCIPGCLRVVATTLRSRSEALLGTGMSYKSSHMPPVPIKTAYMHGLQVN